MIFCGKSLLVTGIATLALAGCATSPDATFVASAERRDCKVRIVDSAAEEIRLANQQVIGGTVLDRTEGEHRLGRIKNFREPAALRFPGAREEGLVSQTLRAC